MAMSWEDKYRQLDRATTKERDEHVREMSLISKKYDECLAKLTKSEQELKIYKTNENILKLHKTSDVVIKKILSFYAKGFTYKNIYDKMVFNKFDGDIGFIKEICQNVEDLDSEYVLYYKKEVQAFEEQLKINPDLIKNQLARVLENNINDASLDLDKLKDISEKAKLRTEITNHAKELNKLLSNIVSESEGFNQNETLSKIAKSLSQTLSDDDDEYEELKVRELEVM